MALELSLADLGRDRWTPWTLSTLPLDLSTSVMCHCRRRGSQVLLGQESHLHVYEQGGIAQVRSPHLPWGQRRLLAAQHFWWKPASQALVGTWGGTVPR